MLIEEAMDTARLIAMCRAVGHEQANARVRDPYARQLAGKRGEMLLQALPPGMQEVWPIVVRTCVYDELLLHTIKQQQVDVVLNLGAGLDTRPYRLALPPGLRWIEVDRPEVLAYKQEHLSGEQPACRLERMPLDLTNARKCRMLLDEVGAMGQRIFVLTEGLLVYLPIDQVAAIAADLSSQPSLRWWLTEFISERELKRDRWNTIAAESAQVRFAPPGGVEFFRLHGWEVAEFRPPVPEALRLKVTIPRKWRLYLVLLLQSLSKLQGDARYAAGGFFLFERMDNNTNSRYAGNDDE